MNWWGLPMQYAHSVSNKTLQQCIQKVGIPPSSRLSPWVPNAGVTGIWGCRPWGWASSPPLTHVFHLSTQGLVSSPGLDLELLPLGSHVCVSAWPSLQSELRAPSAASPTSSVEHSWCLQDLQSSTVFQESGLSERFAGLCSGQGKWPLLQILYLVQLLSQAHLAPVYVLVSSCLDCKSGRAFSSFKAD